MFTPRISWPDLPVPVRDEVQGAMGSSVVSWQGQTGGFSPGTADRLTLADGRRVFCKAVGASLNEVSLDLLRMELRVNRLLPSGLPAPALMHGSELSVGDDPWAVLLFDDLEGRHPHTPWQIDELTAALASVAEVPRLVPVAPAELPTVDELFGPDLAHWDDVVADPPGSLDPWLAERLDDLRARGARARAALVGEALCQLDTRSDNMVVDATGTVWLVDWPYACRGPAWIDTVLLGATASVPGWTPAHEGAVEAAAARLGCDADLLDDVWAGFLGYFVWVAEKPAPDNLPTIRAFQARSRDALLGVLKRRLA
ncbi:phosphotransferase [Aestuariimicrobium sp. T2.26MG-19.2B]|uniref:phosphotransferase n=1 Tax=Aestuariimicrobium sp. T2.26MG-19.2B TaxID=3040679 RepID=UPI0024773153|nr:phosphotransferase [Aestuariimicrobium sp. T2.26MG-19.2B]CAI9401376.1 hypothetical protein AESSP_00580 [Aestuariimicrobium sp. T2.26MG-19.2B]